MKKFAVKTFAVKAFKVKQFGPPPPDLEVELNAEVDAAGALIKTAEQLRMDREAQRTGQQFTDEFDSEFWVCFVFQTRAQKDAAVAALKARGLLPETAGDKYLSGTALARKLGVALPEGPKWRPAPAAKPRWKALARPLKR